MFLTVPEADVANTAVLSRARRTHDMANLMSPWCKTLLVQVVVQRLGISSMSFCRLGEHKNVDVLIEIFESHLQHVQFVKELKRVHNHFLVQK
jgi:hypothetical protein